jgi:purine catabolism regulator
VLSTRSRSISRSRDLGQQAAALCDLLLRTHNPSVTEELGRAALVEILLAGGNASATLLRSWGVHEPTLTAFVLGTKSRSMDLERLAARWLDELGAEHLFTGEAGQIAGFVRDDLVDELSGRVAALNPIGGGLVSLGLGVSAPVAALERSAIQARQAFRSAQESGQTVLRFAELRTVELVFDVLADHSSQQLAAVLDPLREANGEHGALTETLYVFLAEHGGLRASARSLEIHRQTLGARMRRIEALTGLSMNLPDDRAAAWLALRAVGS